MFLVCMSENWINILDKSGFVAAMFMDLSNVFDALNHNVLTSQLGAHRFRKHTLAYMKNILSNMLLGV